MLEVNRTDSVFFDRLREENIEEYGKNVNAYDLLLASLYSNRTHFIYELLQNAEDACERAKRQGQTRKFKVTFELYPDRLEVRNNGILFDEKDIRGICSIAGSADKGLLQIGKFGIGFKSVYAYTNSPEIYSGDASFCIKNYVRPFKSEPLNGLQAEETLFIIRFNDKVEASVAFSEIGNRLRNLGLRTLLFLNNIEEISYKIESTTGKYLKSANTENGVKTVSLHYEESIFVSYNQGRQENRKPSEKWLIFSKPSKEKNKELEIAYQLVYDPSVKKERINPTMDTKLFVYFPTEKETHLKFLVQGPLDTTPARDNIRENKQNQELIAEIGELVATSISSIKAMNLLDINFLNTLPIDIEYFTEGSSVFRPIYNKVKEKLCSDEALLPTSDVCFVSAKLAFLARGRDLSSLLTGEQLDLLFKRTGSKWLDENITDNKVPELWKYLIDELEIRVVDPELFARMFNEDFISKQNDEWVISFYNFLMYQKALWRKESAYSSERPGLLRSKPIIRLGNDSHSLPFNNNGKPIVYLPSKDPSIAKLFARVVKDTIALNEKAREFLTELGLHEPDKVAGVLDLVLPLYKDSGSITEKDNIQHVDWIFKALEDCEGNRRDELLNALEEVPFLYANNTASQQKEYKKPSDIHLGEDYTNKKGLETYFEGNGNTWFLDKRYLVLPDSKKMLEKFKDLGCISRVQVTHNEPNFLNQVIVSDFRGYHRRGLDGFDPECEVEELEHALKNMNIEKSKILWHITRQYRQSVYGQVETSSRQNYEGSRKVGQFSKMGKLLVEYSWLPNSKSPSFHKPSEIMLSELPEGFDKESPETKYLSEKLGFKPEENQKLQELLETTPTQAKEIIEIFMSSSPEIQQQILENARAIKLSDNSLTGGEKLPDEESITQEFSPSLSELEAEFRQALIRERVQSAPVEDKKWTGPTPDEEKKLQDSSLEILSELEKRNPRIAIERKVVTHRKVEETEEEVLRAFLLEEYKGHCQVCNTLLNLGADKGPYFEVYRVIEKHNPAGGWSNQEFNVLCLCPNCHALVKFGGRNLDGISRKAEKVAKGEEAPEEVSERRGDFYIIPVEIAGEKREIFYTPFHMAKISAFFRLTRAQE